MLVFLCLKIKEYAKKPQREDVSYVFLGWLFKLVRERSKITSSRHKGGGVSKKMILDYVGREGYCKR